MLAALRRRLWKKTKPLPAEPEAVTSTATPASTAPKNCQPTEEANGESQSPPMLAHSVAIRQLVGPTSTPMCNGAIQRQAYTGSVDIVGSPTRGRIT